MEPQPTLAAPTYTSGFPLTEDALSAGAPSVHQFSAAGGLPRSLATAAPPASLTAVERANQLLALAKELEDIRHYQALSAVTAPPMDMPSGSAALDSMMLAGNALQLLGLAPPHTLPQPALQMPGAAAAAGLLTPEALQALGLVTLQQSLMAAQRAVLDVYTDGCTDGDRGQHGGPRASGGRSAKAGGGTRGGGLARDEGGKRRDSGRGSRRQDGRSGRKQGGHVIPRAPTWADASWNPRNGVVVDDAKPDTGVFLPGTRSLVRPESPQGSGSGSGSPAGPRSPVATDKGGRRSASALAQDGLQPGPVASPVAPEKLGRYSEQSARGYCSNALPIDWTY